MLKLLHRHERGAAALIALTLVLFLLAVPAGIEAAPALGLTYASAPAGGGGGAESAGLGAWLPIGGSVLVTIGILAAAWWRRR